MDGTHLTFAVPDDQPFARDGLKASVPFGMVVTRLVSMDQRFNRDAAGIRAGARLEAIEWTGEVRLLRDDLARLAEALESPSDGYPKLTAMTVDGRPISFELGRVLLPFIDAVAAAAKPPVEGA